VQQHHNWAVNNLIAPFWPEGNPGQLRSAAATWRTAAGLLNEVTVVLAGASSTMARSCAGVAFDAFYSYADQFVGLRGQHGALLSAAAGTCGALSAACDSYAARIDARRAEVEHLAEAAGVIAAGGLLLTLFTFGGSDVAAEGIDAGIAAELAASAVTRRDRSRGRADPSAQPAVLAAADPG
jgi:hypothetical protein